MRPLLFICTLAASTALLPPACAAATPPRARGPAPVPATARRAQAMAEAKRQIARLQKALASSPSAVDPALRAQLPQQLSEAIDGVLASGMEAGEASTDLHLSTDAELGALRLLEDIWGLVTAAAPRWEKDDLRLILGVLEKLYAGPLGYNGADTSHFGIGMTRDFGSTFVWVRSRDHLRDFVEDASMPLSMRAEVARMLAVCEEPSAAATFFKLCFRADPPGESDVFHRTGADWPSMSDAEKSTYVLAFIAGMTAANRLLGTAVTTTGFSHRVGAYTLELDVYYGKPENRDVTLVEALFHANDALRQP